MKYRDFFSEDILSGGKGDETNPVNLDQEELKLGINVEMEHTKEPRLAREIAIDHLTEDPKYYSKLYGAGLADEPANPFSNPSGIPMNGDAMDVPTRVGVVAIGKIVGSGQAFKPDANNGISVPGDKEKITAAGKVDIKSVEKSVGGSVSPGEGQKQGGPNTQGKIEKTPQSSEISNDSSTNNSAGGNKIGSIDGTPKNSMIGEGSLKEIIKSEIKSVLKEMWLGWGNPESKESSPEGDINRDEMPSDELDKDTKTESAPPGFPQDLENKIKKQYGSDSPKAYATMWKIHNKGWVKEVQNRMR